MRTVRLTPGRPLPGDLEGGILACDLTVDGEAWHKGRRLSTADLLRLVAAGGARVRGLWSRGSDGAAAVSILLPGAGDLHEDEAALRIAAAVAGRGLTIRGPAESRVDLVAAHDGVLRVSAGLLDRIDRIDPVAIFTAFDGQVVASGTVVASAKVGPHVVPAAIVERVERLAAGSAARGRPVVRVDPFEPKRIAVLVKQTLAPAARARFEASVAAKVTGLGSELTAVAYVADETEAIVGAMRPLSRGHGRADVVLTAGAASTDPSDPFFVALERLRGRIVSHGVPAHPGSMLWLGRVGRTVILGLPTCGAYSRATAVDLLLPWILAGAPADRRTVARLGQGGLLTRDMRFRFPPYARELDAPEG